MAEINIKRKSTPVWAWIIGLLVLIAIGVLVYTMVLQEDRAPATTESVQESNSNPSTY